MTHQFQHTIAREFSFSGRGLHTGDLCKVSILPAASDTGILFRRTDLGGKAIPATIDHAQKLVRCSGLQKNGATIRTCEHLLAALYACGIDNAEVIMTNEEVPILDGSAKQLVSFIEEAGAIRQDIKRRFIEIASPIESRDGERFVRIEPAPDLSIDLSLTLRRFGTISWSGPLDRKNFKTEIAPARTFAPLRHALPVKIYSMITGTPIARGASLDNLLVYARGKVWNPGGLRFKNELARHRVLDIVGDLMLAGKMVAGKITAFRSSHSLNQDLVNKISKIS